MRAITATACLILVLVFVEVALGMFFAESNGAGTTLASQRWLDKYWHPINSFGYRDHEPVAGDLVGKRVVWVVGDSYAAGWGIANPADRFSDRLAEKLGPHWKVFNIAKPGWDTRRQRDAVSRFPYPPDAVVHTYCLNDADRAAEQQALTVPRSSRDRAAGWLKPAIENFHLPNLIYWRTRNWFTDAASTEYWNYVKACYQTPAVWDAHRADLHDLVRAYQDHTPTVVAVIIPNLLDVSSSHLWTAQVADFFEAEGVVPVDLTEPLSGRNPSDLVVNRFDPHANESVHALIAELVFDRLHDVMRGCPTPVESALQTVHSP